MNVLVVGSVTGPHNLEQIVHQAIRDCNFPIDHLIVREDMGVDHYARTYAAINNIPLIDFRADWYNLDVNDPKDLRIKRDEHGKKINKNAGIIANRKAIESAQAVVVVWDGQSAGARDILRRARERNLPTWVVTFRPEE